MTYRPTQGYQPRSPGKDSGPPSGGSSAIRTSLSHTDSGWTDAEKAARMILLERNLWHLYGAIVIRESDPVVGLVVSEIGQTRFGKREVRA